MPTRRIAQTQGNGIATPDVLSTMGPRMFGIAAPLQLSDLDDILTDSRFSPVPDVL